MKLLSGNSISLNEKQKVRQSLTDITKNGELVDLTSKEYEILKLLLLNPKRVYTKAQIYNQVWNDEYFGDENAVNVHICRLRTKIEDNPKNPKYIKTIWGVGYKIGEQYE